MKDLLPALKLVHIESTKSLADDLTPLLEQHEKLVEALIE
jgi:hypothetical protein